MARRRPLLVAVVTSVAVTALLAACSSSSSTTSAAAGTTSTSTSTSTSTTTSAPEGTAVGVTVGETDLQHMYMKLDTETIPSGKVTFTVTNEGVKKHEFVILQTDTPVAKLTVKGDEVVEDDYTAIDEIEDIEGGTTEDLTVTLDPGHYDVICNIKGHYRMGMYAEFDVT